MVVVCVLIAVAVVVMCSRHCVNHWRAIRGAGSWSCRLEVLAAIAVRAYCRSVFCV
jgi:hypothetical protein